VLFFCKIFLTIFVTYAKILIRVGVLRPDADFPADFSQKTVEKSDISEERRRKCLPLTNW
jgi:hypothetical protein